MNWRVLFLCLALGGCGGGGSDSPSTPTAPPPAPVLSRIEVVLPSSTVAPGAKVQATARGFDQFNTPMSLGNLAWASSTPSVATVSDAGLVTALVAGTATITARSGSISGSATLTVTPSPAPALSRIEVTLSASTVTLGAQVQATANGFDQFNAPIALGPVAWSSSPQSVASISNSGLITTLLAGTTTITATSGSISGTGTLTVTASPTPVLSRIVVTLSASSAASGDSVQATASGFDQFNAPISVGSLTWTTSSSAVATVSTSGQVTTLLVGTTTITATSGGVAGGATLTVTPGRATQLFLTRPAAVAISGAPFGTQPIVEVRDSAGNRVTSDNSTTIQFATPTAAGTVGTLVRTVTSGVATFTNVGIVGAVGSTHSLVYSAAGLSSATQTIEIAPFSFGNGTYLIGAAIPAGQYRSVNAQTASCYWARLKDTSGASGSIIANDIGPGPRVVEILASDYAFESSSCAQWSQVTGPVTSSPTAPFSNGIYIVGLDVQPGLWRSQTVGSSSCYWARLRNTTGSDDILANDLGIGPRVVEILASDKAFESSSCSQWSRVIGPITSSPTAPFSDGVYVVGVDIQPGTWRSDGTGSSCYWARLRNFTGTDEIIANYVGSAPATVTILSSDVGFSASRCGTWSKVQ